MCKVNDQNVVKKLNEEYMERQLLNKELKYLYRKFRVSVYYIISTIKWSSKHQEKRTNLLTRDKIGTFNDWGNNSMQRSDKSISLFGEKDNEVFAEKGYSVVS